MDNRDHKIKVEYGVSAVVLLVGIFFIFQAFTITASQESVGPRTLPIILAVSLMLGGLRLAFRAFSASSGVIDGRLGIYRPATESEPGVSQSL